MNPWTLWLDTLNAALAALSTDVGLGLGLAIIVSTLALRFALLPVSWPLALRNRLRQKKMQTLKPELERLKAQLGNRPEEYGTRMLALYREHGLSPVDGKSLLGALVQMPVFVGMFRVLRGAGDGARFLWVPNLSKPDPALAVIAGLATALLMIVNPDLPEQMRMLLIVLPCIVAVITAMHFGSALALYWTTSNCFSLAQTLALQRVVAKRASAGGTSD